MSTTVFRPTLQKYISGDNDFPPPIHFPSGARARHRRYSRLTRRTATVTGFRVVAAAAAAAAAGGLPSVIGRVHVSRRRRVRHDRRDDQQTRCDPMVSAVLLHGCDGARTRIGRRDDWDETGPGRRYISCAQNRKCPRPGRAVKTRWQGRRCRQRRNGGDPVNAGVRRRNGPLATSAVQRIRHSRVPRR